MKYRKKPVIIEAVKWDGRRKTFDEIVKLNTLDRGLNYDLKTKKINIKTLEGWHEGNIGDFIIQGVRGELYPCKPDVFEKSYELIKE
jgi:hypothetical protein